MAVYINRREEIARVAELGGTSDFRIVADTVGLMKETGGTVTVLQGTSPWVTTPSGGTIVIGPGSYVIGTVDARQSGTWYVTITETSTVVALQGGTWNVNQSISSAGYFVITDGTSTVGVTADGKLKTDAILNVSQTATYVWSSANVGAGGTSPAIDLREYTNITVFGVSSNPTTISVLISPDDTTYFEDMAIRTTSSSDEWATDTPRGGFYYKLKSSNSSTITAGFMAKT
jgi:hypothetical protein